MSLASVQKTINARQINATSSSDANLRAFETSAIVLSERQNLFHLEVNAPEFSQHKFETKAIT